MTHCRNAVLFAALAAESYVNEFLGAFLDGSDYTAVDRMSPVDKYVLGTKFATGDKLFDRQGAPVTKIAALFALRNKLVHPKPGFGPAPFAEPWGEFEENFPPPRAAEFIVTVARAAVILVKRAYGAGHLDDVWANVIWQGREAILGYGERSTGVPGQYDQPEEDLFIQATRLLAP